MPLIRRLPKRGFNNAAFHKSYGIVNLGDLNRFKAGSVVNEKVLRESELVRGDVAGVKILGEGELKHPLTIEVDKASASAREKIEKAGATLTLRDDRALSRDKTQSAESAVAEKPVQLPKKSSARKRSGASARAPREKKPPGKR